MKRILLSFGLCLLMAGMSFGQDLIITGAYDGPLSGGTPKGIELYVTGNIADLSLYAVGSANNGDGTDGAEFTLSGSATEGDYIYIASESTQFTAFFGFAPTFTSGSMGINGDDAIELFFDSGADGFTAGDVIDVFGDIDTDGTGQAWEYLDGWAYRVTNTTLDDSTFAIGNWTFSSPNALDNALTNSDDGLVAFPLGTYNDAAIPNVTIYGDAGWRMLSLPITGGDVEDVSDDTPVQGITGGSDSGNNANFFINPASDGTSGNGYVEPTNTTTAWGDGEGFILYFYDNTTNGSEELPVTLDASGSEPSGDVTVTLTNTYTLLGNPYASNFNVDGLSGNGSGLNSTVSIFSDTDGNFRTINIGSGDIVGPWQGFFVERTDGTTTQATIAEASKTTSVSGSRVFSKVNNEIASINLSLRTPNGLADNGNKLYFTNQATFDGNDRYDGGKLAGLVGAPTLAFVNNGELLAQDARPFDITETQSYTLEFADAGISGEYTVSWPMIKNIPDSWEMTFKDLESGEVVNMKNIDSYTFEVIAKQKRPAVSALKLPVVKQKEVNGDQRFEITIAPNTSVSIDDEVSKVDAFKLDQNYPNPFNPTTNINYTVGEAGAVNITVYNVMGQKVAELLNTTKSAGSYQLSWDATGQASGIYYYRLTTPGVVLTRQMTLIK